MEGNYYANYFSERSGLYGVSWMDFGRDGGLTGNRGELGGVSCGPGTGNGKGKMRGFFPFTLLRGRKTILLSV